MKKLFYLVLIVSLGLFIACESSTEPKEEEPLTEFEKIAERGNEYFTNYTNAAGAGVNITISALFDLLTDGDTSNDPYIMDFRSATYYNERHIIGAVNVTYDTLVALVNDGTIPKDRPIVNICYSGQGASAATAFLNMLGYQAQNLKFAYCGIDTSISRATGWVSKIAEDEFTNLETTTNTTTATYDFPVLDTGEETADAIIKSRYTYIRENSGTRVSLDDLLNSPDDYFILNYWTAAHYENPGHIPGAYQFEPKASLGTDQMLNLLPTDKTIVVYCYTGQTSNQVMTYLRMLGYDAASLSYGVNGFAYHALDAIGYQYKGPAPGIYDSILTP